MALATPRHVQGTGISGPPMKSGDPKSLKIKYFSRAFEMANASAADSKPELSV